MHLLHLEDHGWGEVGGWAGVGWGSGGGGTFYGVHSHVARIHSL